MKKSKFKKLRWFRLVSDKKKSISIKIAWEVGIKIARRKAIQNAPWMSHDKILGCSNVRFLGAWRAQTYHAASSRYGNPHATVKPRIYGEKWAFLPFFVTENHGLWSCPTCMSPSLRAFKCQPLIRTGFLQGNADNPVFQLENLTKVEKWQ